MKVLQMVQQGDPMAQFADPAIAKAVNQYIQSSPSTGGGGFGSFLSDTFKNTLPVAAMIGSGVLGAVAGPALAGGGLAGTPIGLDAAANAAFIDSAAAAGSGFSGLTAGTGGAVAGGLAAQAAAPAAQEAAPAAAQTAAPVAAPAPAPVTPPAPPSGFPSLPPGVNQALQVASAAKAANAAINGKGDVGSALISGFKAASGFDSIFDQVAGNASDAGEALPGTGSDAGLPTAANASLAQSQLGSGVETGVAPTAQSFINPELPGQGSDAGLPSAANASAQGSPPSSNGIINSVLDFAKQNPTATATLGTVAAGALGGLGRGAAEVLAANKKAESDKALIDAKRQADLDLLSGKTALAQANSFKGSIPFSAAPGQVLRRPDGIPVFSGGIIGSRVG
jgi:hypothetical protein